MACCGLSLTKKHMSQLTLGAGSSVFVCLLLDLLPAITPRVGRCVEAHTEEHVILSSRPLSPDKRSPSS